jgi:hypothetical protein
MMNTNKLNKINSVMLAAVVLLAGMTASCKKKEAEAPENAFNFPAPAYPALPADADVMLVAINSSVPSPIAVPTVPGMPAGMDIVLEIGVGVAVFKNNAKADKVLLNNTELKFVNGVHTWQPDFTNVTDPSSLTGINLSGNIKWDITNPTLTKTTSALPGKPTINSGKSITKSSGYTLTNQSSSGAAKIIYSIYSTNGKFVQKELAGSSIQCSFTAGELAELGATKDAIIQACAYKISSETISGKKVYLINQAAYSVTGVTIN